MGEEGRERIPSSSKQERALIKIRAEIIESREGAASFFLLRRRGSDIRDREDEENNIFAAFAPKAASAEKERERERSSLLGAFVHHRIKRLDGCDCERLRVGILLKGYGKDCLSLCLFPLGFISLQ